MRGGVSLSKVEEKLKQFFTDFDGKFDAQLSNVSVSSVEVDEQFGTSSPYSCRVKTQYNRELLRLLDNLNNQHVKFAISNITFPRLVTQTQ